MDVLVGFVPTSSRMQTGYTLWSVTPDARIKWQLTFRFDQRAERIKKPPMAVQFLLVLFFETEDDLNGTGVHGGLPTVGTNNAGGILENMRGDRLAIDGVFSDAFLVAAHLRGH